MKIKIIDLIQFDGFYQDVKNNQINALNNLKINKLEKICIVYKQEYNKKLLELQKIYANKNENNELLYDNDGNVIFSPENKIEYMNEVYEYNNTIVDIEEEIHFSLSELDELNMSILNVGRILAFIEG